MSKEECIEIPASLLRDERISPTAKGVLCVMLACKQDYQLESKLLALLSPLNRQTCVEQLKSFGYLNPRTGELLRGPKTFEFYADKYVIKSSPKPSKKKKRKKKGRKAQTAPVRQKLMAEAKNLWTREHVKMPYPEFLKSKYWGCIRQLKKLECADTCQHCGSHNFLQVHHTNYQFRGIEHLHLDSLKVLCDWCHKKEHGL